MKIAWVAAITYIVFNTSALWAMGVRGGISGTISNLTVDEIAVQACGSAQVKLSTCCGPFVPPVDPPTPPAPPKKGSHCDQYTVDLDLNDVTDAANYQLFLKAQGSWSSISLTIGSDGQITSAVLDSGVPCTTPAKPVAR